VVLTANQRSQPAIGPAGTEASARRRRDIAEYDRTVLGTCRARRQNPRALGACILGARALSMATAR
jgi:hypothetical protein